MKTYEHRIGGRKIYGIVQGDGTCLILADCAAHQEACVKFSVPAEAASVYFEVDRQARPAIQDLFPDLRAEHREILVLGTSPAEFDQIYGEVPEDEEEFKRKYGPLGYTFDPP